MRTYANTGVLTFAGNNYRNSFTYGTQDVQDKTLTPSGKGHR
jgi:hypothetical protein